MHKQADSKRVKLRPYKHMQMQHTSAVSNKSDKTFFTSRISNDSICIESVAIHFSCNFLIQVCKRRPYRCHSRSTMAVNKLAIRNYT